MKKRKLALLLAGVLTVASVLTACGSKDGGNKPAESGAPAANGNGTTLTICVGPEPDTIDPALNSAVDGGTLINHAFEGLMRLSKDGVTYEEGLAEKYEISEDQLTYTFTLRDGLKWSDGSDLTANDFVYSWNRDPLLANLLEGMKWPTPLLTFFSNVPNRTSASLSFKSIVNHES